MSTRKKESHKQVGCGCTNNIKNKANDLFFLKKNQQSI